MVSFNSIAKRAKRKADNFTLRSPFNQPTDQYLFDHIPRTGGSYFASILEELIGSASENIDCAPDFPDRHPEEMLRLDRCQIIVGHLRLDTVKAFRKIRPRRLISLVREPADQIASTYSFWRFNITEDLPHCNLAKTLTFGEFIREPSLRMAVDNPMTRHFYGLWDVENLEVNETTMVMATRMADSYAFIGVTERMEDTVKAFRKTFKTRPTRRKFEQIDRNESKGKVTVAQEDIEFLKERNKLDYAIYRHANEVLDQILARN